MESAQRPGEHLIINITGEKVALGPLRRDLVPLYLQWINDFEVTRTLGIGIRPATLESEEAWYDATTRKQGVVDFTAYELPGLRPIGNAGLHGINHEHRTAGLGIMVGAKDCWGKGYGTEIVSLVLDYGFTVLGLHNIMLGVYSYNERAIRVYNRAGFRLVGRRRQAWRLGGEAYDVIYMDCLASEFQSRVLRRLLPEGPASQAGGS